MLARAQEALQTLVARFGEPDAVDFTGDDNAREQMDAWRVQIAELEQVQPAIINHHQLAQIIDAVRPPAAAAGGAGGAGVAGGAPAAPAADAPGRTKPQTLTSEEGTDWRVWRDHFTLVIEENGYAAVNHDRAKRQIKIHIYGKAAFLTRDIDYITAAEATNNGVPEETYEDFFDRLETRFLPRSAQLAARTAFESSKQKSDEAIGKWHARLITEYSLAYPDVDNPNLDTHLIRKFQYGLKDAAVQSHVMQHEPVEYAAALQLAEAKYAVLTAVASCHRPGGGRINNLDAKDIKSVVQGIKKEVIAAMDQRTRTSGAEANKRLRRGDFEGAPTPNPGGKLCYKCQSPYHLSAACNVQKLQEGGRAATDNSNEGGGVGAMSNRARKRAALAKKKAATAAGKKVAAVEDSEQEASDATSVMLAALLKNTGIDGHA